ncbi:MAG: signal peptide and transrane prediction [Chthoniobacteraceae bacterium]|nr:signal peptide and transrane prediction [Chthoniobacteraceae bacterium]
MKILSSLFALATLSSLVHAADFVTYEGKEGPGKGKHIVFLAGDEEYRSEEALPQLARILSERHGFKCTVSFSVNAATGDIDPNTADNQPGIEALDTADLCITSLRFRHWPDAQMKHFSDYYLAGKPFIALRTSTHAFSGIPGSSPFAKFSNGNKAWDGGFGRQVLGEQWVNHWGGHKSQATRGIIEESAKNDPILRGVEEIFGTTDVYEADPLPPSKILVRGQVLKGMKPTDEPATGQKKRKDGVEQGLNEPMQPIVWTREYLNEAGKTNKVLTTTMGAASDLPNEGLRRLIVNGAYWAVGLEAKIPAKNDVTLVGEFNPSPYGFGGSVKGVKPSAYEVK